MSKILVIDINALPVGWSVGEFLKTIEETGIVFMDTQQDGVNFKDMPVKVIDSDNIGGIKIVDEIENIKCKQMGEENEK